MSFDFSGTFNRSQFERFLTFARSQLPLVAGRQAHLNAEISRIGTVIFKFDKGVPLGYSADPETSYLGKLLAAYEVQGGAAALDLRVRLRTDPIFILRGDESTGATMTSGGEPLGAKGLMDGVTGELMRVARDWLEDTLQARFGRLERKIRRAMDYSDQLQAESQTLQTIQLAAEAKGSLEFIAAQVAQYLADPNYLAIYDDQAQGKPDPLGLNVYAPFASYDASAPKDPNLDVNRLATTPQRQPKGFVGPGEQG